MNIRICLKSFATSGMLILPHTTCSAPSSTPPVIIPRSNVALETLVFAPGQAIVKAVPTGIYDICRDNAMSPEFKVTSITIWTGSIFRAAIPATNHCPFSVLSKHRYRPQSGDIRTKDCIARVLSHGSTISSITMFVNEESKRNYFQCEYRLSMAFIGFHGALYIPEDVLFVKSSHPEALYGYPVLRAYSSIMPESFVHLQWQCRVPPTIVYHPEPGQTRQQVNTSFRNSSCKR